jgi:D,D-heptose 1,7-bisphosphate phosphatase
MGNTVSQAFILVGGKGTRLGELTAATPKPMLLVGGQPFLSYLIDTLRRYGFRDIVLLAGYYAEQIQAYCDGFDPAFGSVRCVVEEQALGTGGAHKHAAAVLDPEFLVLNGDTHIDLKMNDLLVAGLDASLGRLALRSVPDTARYGRVTLDAGRLVGFNEKGVGGAGMINGGVYYLSRSVLDLIPESFFSLETDLFPQLIAEGKLEGRAYAGFFLDIGVPEDYRQAQTQIPAWTERPAVFLDRDGVINRDLGYVCSPERFEWIAGAPAAIKRLNESGYFVFVVTNQAGVARGFYTEAGVHAFHAWLQQELRGAGAHIDAFYYCPHHPEFGSPCSCRKPEPGMLLKARAEWPVKWPQSFLIGDKDSDLASARNAGIEGYLFDAAQTLDQFVEALLSARPPAPSIN